MRAYLQDWSDGSENIVVHAAGLPFGWRESNISDIEEKAAIDVVRKQLGPDFNGVAWLNELGERIVKTLPIR